MPSGIILIYGLAAALISCAVWLFQRSERLETREKINQRWHGLAHSKLSESEHKKKSPLFTERLLWRAGMVRRDWHFPVAIFTLLSLGGVGWKLFDLFGMFLFPCGAILLLYFWLHYKAEKRSALVLVQLPLFLDQVLRALGTGRSMDGALGLAAAEATDPLKEIIDRVLRLTSLGADLSTVLEETADIYRIREWYLLALAVKINRTYGSGVRDLLESVISMIRQQESARRELKSLTGETRISAWVLGLLPTAMAFYMMAINPSYLGGMWADASGRTILIAALGLQIFGGFVLWRMIKSI